MDDDHKQDPPAMEADDGGNVDVTLPKDEEEQGVKEEQQGVNDSAKSSMLALDGSAMGYAGMFCSATILLVALVVKGEPRKGDKYYGYGLSIAIVSMFLALVGLAMSMLKNNAQSAQSLVSINTFMTLWSFIGAGFLTSSKGPFEQVGNGYFSSWGLVIFCCMALGSSAVGAAGQQAPTGLGAMIGLKAAAIVLLFAISDEGLDKDDKYFGESLYGLILSILTILLMGCMSGTELKGQPASGLKFPILVTLGINWITAANLLTFRGPFQAVSNGYFGAWACAVAVLFAAMACWKGMRQQGGGGDKFD